MLLRAGMDLRKCGHGVVTHRSTKQDLASFPRETRNTHRQYEFLVPSAG